MQKGEQIRKFVEGAVKGVVEKADQVDISLVEHSDKNTLIVVKCAESDVGLIIGKKGKTITAIRDICFAIATKFKIKVTILIDE